MAPDRPRGLLLRRRADRSDPAALEADLPGAPPGTWPLAGVDHVGQPPRTTTIPTHIVERGVEEGWIQSEGDQVVTRPGGPPGNPWRTDKVHVFVHREALTICGVGYRVVHQPDKYADPGDDDTPVTDDTYAAGATRVDHFYGLELAEEGSTDG